MAYAALAAMFAAAFFFLQFFPIFGLILQLLVWGFIGYLAGRLLRGEGYGALGNILLGLFGGIIGSIVLRLLGLSSVLGIPFIGGIIGGVIGAIIFIFIMRLIDRNFAQ